MAETYASATSSLFCSTTDTYGQVVLEAGASGAPVVAVAEKGKTIDRQQASRGRYCYPPVA
jgi:glycosyltransferase involved in cell wall biosynthesis